MQDAWSSHPQGHGSLQKHQGERAQTRPTAEQETTEQGEVLLGRQQGYERAEESERQPFQARAKRVARNQIRACRGIASWQISCHDFLCTPDSGQSAPTEVTVPANTP